MSDNLNRISQFWQELKRRNVTRVLAVYIAAAFMLLELISMFSEQIGLPDGTWKVAFFISLAGLVIAVIVSWIYDIHPEEGMVKTEPTNHVSEEIAPSSFKGWKIASYMSFVVIVGLIVLNIIPRSDHNDFNDRSIAVLPFRNDSPDESKMYFINGTMDAILDNLCKIADLRVVSRTSVEQYRNNPKPITVVAEEMNVSHVLEGSGQKIGNRVLLTVQLLDGKTDQHLWSKQYDREIEKVEDLIDIQKEISELVTGEIEVIITPEEQELIEKVPTTNLTAYDFYQRGKEEYSNGNIDIAEFLFREALSADPAFAQAHSGLGFVYWRKHFSDEFFSERFIDSALILANTALSYDKELSDAYRLRGNYYSLTGQMTLAEEEFDKGIRYNPNDWLLYRNRAYILRHDDQVKVLENLYKAASLNRGPEFAGILQAIGSTYLQAGCFEKAIEIQEEVLKLNRDSAAYYRTLAFIQDYQENDVKSHEYLMKVNRLDSTYFLRDHNLGLSYLRIGDNEAALECYKKYLNYHESTGNISNLLWSYHRIGYAFLVNGFRGKAEYYFHKLFESSTKEIELGRYRSEIYYSYYDLSAIYAILGQKEKAYENLRIFNQRKIMHAWMYDLIKTDPLFNSIRDEPEFQQIIRDVEAKYQAEHERVRKWLEENDML